MSDVPLCTEKLHRFGEGRFFGSIPRLGPDVHVTEHAYAGGGSRCVRWHWQRRELLHETPSVDHACQTGTARVIHQDRFDRLHVDGRLHLLPLHGSGARQVDRQPRFLYSSGVNSSKQVHDVADRLREAFGSMKLDASDPVETLVLTILSQNTNDRNRDRAYAALREAYADWDAVRTARLDELAGVIRPGGLHRQKAQHIQEALARIRAVGDADTFDLSLLEEMPTDRALEWLTQLHGVGKKTAGIVLLFSFGKPYFPVDTHIARVTRRLGWIGSSDRDPHDALNSQIDADPVLMRELHLHLIALGRSICRARRPACSVCPLRDLCAEATETPSENKGPVRLPESEDA